jgi:hypothetical protein
MIFRKELEMDEKKEVKLKPDVKLVDPFVSAFTAFGLGFGVALVFNGISRIRYIIKH